MAIVDGGTYEAIFLNEFVVFCRLEVRLLRRQLVRTRGVEVGWRRSIALLCKVVGSGLALAAAVVAARGDGGSERSTEVVPRRKGLGVILGRLVGEAALALALLEAEWSAGVKLKLGIERVPKIVIHGRGH